RRSTASWAPVLAPLGTAARPRAPETSSTSTSTVGLPRESRISRPTTSSTMLTKTPGANVANVYGLALAVAANARSVQGARSPAGALPELPDGRALGRREVDALGGGERLHPDEAVPEPAGPRAERGLAAEAVARAGRDQRGERGSERALVGRRGGDVDRPEAGVRVETDGRTLAQQLLDVEQRREAGGDPFHERVVALLLFLDLLPV